MYTPKRMRLASTIRLSLAIICSWQTAYQICDRYGDAFKAIAAQVSASKTATIVSGRDEVDCDAFLPLTLGRTLLPGHADLTPRLTAVRLPQSQLGHSSADRAVSPQGPSPPCLSRIVSATPPSRLPLLARAAVYSLAPPAV